MPGDFVNEVQPSSKIRPVTPHPANVREERKKKQEKRQRQKGGKHRENADRDKVSLEQNRPRKPDGKQERKPQEKSSDNPENKRTIDITV
jgi:hypothetical protein